LEAGAELKREIRFPAGLEEILRRSLGLLWILDRGAVEGWRNEDFPKSKKRDVIDVMGAQNYGYFIHVWKYYFAPRVEFVDGAAEGTEIEIRSLVSV